MDLGGDLGDKYAALIGLSHTMIFNIENPSDSTSLFPLGGVCGSWIKNHQLLLSGDHLITIDPRHNMVTEFFTSSKIVLLCVHPVNPFFYVYTADKRLIFYDMSLRLPTHTIPLQSPFPMLTSLDVSADSQRLIATTIDGRVVGWSLLTGSLENEMLITGEGSLVQVQALGHDAAAVLDSNGHLYWLDLARQWWYLVPYPILPRKDMTYNHQRGVLLSSFGDQVEVLTATNRSILDLSKFGDISNIAVSRDGRTLVACHGRHLTVSSLVSGDLIWRGPLAQDFMGQKVLAVIPFCS